MKRISIIAVLTTIVPITSFAYDYTIFDADLRSRSYTVQEISQTVYNNALTSAESQGLNTPPVFKTIENGQTKYYKWIAPDLMGYKTNTNADIFSSTNQGNGYISSLNINNGGTVSTQRSYYTDLLRTYNRIENVSANTNINLWFIANPRSDIGDPVVGGAFSNSVADIIGIGGGFVGNSVRSNVSGVKAFGGAIYNNGQAIDLIDGVFIDNSASSVSIGSVGGAIYNTGNTINRINGVFIGNSTEGGSISSGGAIANQRVNNGFTEIGQILGVFISNHSSGDGAGIYNDLGTIDTITGDFVANSADYLGGAICNSTGEINAITGDFFGNSATSGGAIWSGVLSGEGNISNIEMIRGVFVDNSATRSGGAISNTSFRSTIETIEANFINNSVKGSLYLEDTAGGAIYNNGIIGEINGDFSYNFVSGNAYNKDFRAGAIYNYERIDAINGNFIGNYVVASSQGSYAQGGAIYNNNVGSTIGSITGAFIDNSASSTYNGGWGAAFGGAIYNRGTIESIEADFRNNSVLSNGISGSMPVAQGGAIYNGEFATINSISGDFINNFIADGASTQEDGGAIYNKGTIGSLTGLFNGNSTQNHGGAIYNDTTAVIQNLSGDFFGNTAQNGGAIYNLGNIGMHDTVRFGTISDTIYNSGTITTSGTNDNQANIYLQSVSGNGTLNLNGYTNAYLTNGQTISQDNLGISENSVLYTATNGLNVTNITNNGLISLTGGTLEQNLSYYAHGGNVELSGSISGLADKLDIATTNKGTLTLTGGTLSNAVSGTGNIVIAENVISTVDVIQNVAINSDKSLTVSADHIHSASLTNNGLLKLSGGTLSENISLYGNSEFIGNVSSNANYLDQNIINRGTLTLTGGTLSNDVTGNGNTVVSGNVTASADNLQQTTHIDTGALTLTGGTLITNLTGNTAINTGVLNSMATNIQNNQFINNGTLNLNGGTLSHNITGTGLVSLANVDLGSNHIQIQNGSTVIDGLLQLNIEYLAANSSVYTGGNLDIIGDLTINPDSELRLVIAPSLLMDYQTTGELELVSVSGGLSGNFDILSANNMYTISRSGNKYIISRGSSIEDVIHNVSDNSNFVNAGIAWNNAIFANNTLEHDIQDTLSYLAQYDAEGYVEALDNIVPADVNVADTSFRNINAGIIKQFSERFSSLKAENRSGDESVQAKFNIWTQGLFNKFEQTGKSKFDAGTTGITLGAETIFDDKLVFAAGYTYGKTSGKSGAKDINGNMSIFSLYAEYDMDKLYVNGGLSYGMASYEQTTKYKNDAEFDANTISLNAGVGYNLDKFTPEVRAIYTTTSVDKYKDAAGQEIQYDDNSMLSLVPSVKYKDAFKMGVATLMPEITLGIIYDVVSDDSVAKVDLGTAQYFVYGEKISPFGLNIGIGTGVYVGNWNFAIGYDLDWRDNFMSHTGKMKAKYMF